MSAPSGQRPPPRTGTVACVVLAFPVVYLAAAVAARSLGGPFWLWFNVDPDYFYLFDALNVLNLSAPGHVYHPGTTVQWLGALALKARSPLAGADAITADALADPERALALISGVIVGLNGLGLVALGWAAWRAVRDLLAVAVLGAAPFVSMVVFKNSLHAKPEGLLLLTALMLSAVAVLSLAPGLMARHKTRFAVAFGVIAGFGAVTKITALPVFVLPLFVLAERRAVALYVAAAAGSALLFAAPALPNAGVFLGWIATVAGATGAYGGGEAGFIDWAAYPKDVLHLLKRPAFHVPLALSVLALAWAARRRHRGAAVPAPEARLLAGIVAAGLAHVLLVAKQPSVHYLIPSLALAPLAIVVAWRLVRALATEGRSAPAAAGRAARALRPLVALLLAALIAGQGHGFYKLAHELAEASNAALAADDGRFRACARVYAATASSRSYALLNGDFITGARFAERLATQAPAGDYWLEHSWGPSPVTFRGWRGSENPARALAEFPCVMVRSSRWHEVAAALEAQAPGLKFAADCSTPSETILVAGADCRGRAVP